MHCPSCNSVIPATNLNIQTDVGKCDSCGNVFRISAVITGADPVFNVNEKPKGTWYTENINNVIAGASTRHWISFFMVPFMIIWSGFSLGGIYGTQLFTGHLNPMLSLFGIPFILGSILFWSLTIMLIWGKVEVTADKEGGKIFTGVSSIGITRQFKWKEITTISEGAVNYRYPGSYGGVIVMEGKKRLSFGSGLNEARKYYLLQVLKKLQAKYRNNKEVKNANA